VKHRTDLCQALNEDEPTEMPYGLIAVPVGTKRQKNGFLEAGPGWMLTDEGNWEPTPE